MPYKYLLLDLDDTLFEEKDYVKSGFHFIADYLQDQHKINAKTNYALMLELLEKNGRGRIFNDILQHNNLPDTPTAVKNLVDIYRHHSPNIHLYDGVEACLKTLAKHCKLTLVTNGLKVMQENKVNALKIKDYFQDILYCDAMGAPKPAPLALLTAISNMGAPRAECLMVGDNPETDGAAAKAAHVSFVRVKSGRFAHIDHYGPTIPYFTSLPAFLRESQL